MRNDIPRVLFICKKRPAIYGASYGLLNSCRFLCNALHDMGVEAKTVEVVDNNGIDHEVHHYKPTHVFIEALWVVPEKFDTLIKLHPRVQWNVRLHSNIPFIANEGTAMDWIKKYIDLQKKYAQFNIAPNAQLMVNDLYHTFGVHTVYAPNIYQPSINEEEFANYIPPDKHPRTIEIGCFGAIRPLKNQLIQAMAAIAFARELKQTLHFHINYTRIETNGDNVYKNIQSLFDGTKHKLIIHNWLTHHEFMKLICRMELGLQVSFSETFNIVSADFVHLNVPLVGSKQIEWLSGKYQADPNDLENIVSHLRVAWLGREDNLQNLNKKGLNSWNKAARKVWKNYMNYPSLKERVSRRNSDVPATHFEE